MGGWWVVGGVCVWGGPQERADPNLLSKRKSGNQQGAAFAQACQKLAETGIELAKPPQLSASTLPYPPHDIATSPTPGPHWEGISHNKAGRCPWC